MTTENTPSTTTQINQLSPSLLLNEIDSRIVKVAPSRTPLDQISRLAGARSAGSMVVDYYSNDVKEISGRVYKAEKAEDIDSDTVCMLVTFRNNKAFNETDTLMFPEVLADPDNPESPCLTAYISKKMDSPGQFLMVLVNSSISDPGALRNQYAVRMGRAAAELDVQTPIFESIPKKKTNFCQIFKTQIEQSTLVKIANKEVGWDFSDQEEIAFSDMRRAMEKSYLFGQQARIVDPIRHEDIFLTGGIWEQAGNTYEYSDEFTFDSLMELSRMAFVGNSGSNRKVLIGGSGFMTRLHALEKTFRVLGPRDYVTKWGIDFNEIHTKFGTFYVLLSETFDECMNPDSAMVIDPEYITKYAHIPFSTEQLDLRSAGIRNSDATVITEASCLVLRYPQAHIRIRRKAAEPAEE